ncbi:signal peptidase II [Facklamia miroungae]|uniref:Lipoprotein signal peptidase n=1 Tax=Facklamia miroungae TaxID=120956 RepID=A0A1G7P9S7_9LACT|nr:signal peptidase II [Facklamia miroungae]NKZ28633.1 signal peptidase II [Facklamia miroungae]SDF83023.1 signal peptidase II [Facklamia miroungae]
MVTTIIITGLVIIFDQALKFWTQNNIELNKPLEIIPDFFQLNYTQNIGAGWGLFAGQRLFLIGITFVVIFYLLYLTWRNRESFIYSKIAYGLLLGGAIGNLIDRLTRGYVIDMLQVRLFDFPVFNLADAALSLGVVLLIVIVIWTEKGSDLI